MLDTMIGAMFGFGAAIFSEPLRRWIYRPELKLEFGDSDAYKTLTSESAEIWDFKLQKSIPTVYDARYLRVKVTNTKFAMAKNCRAYLVAVDKETSAGVFEPTVYCDSIPLAWSCSADKAYEPLNLPKGVEQFIDIVSTRSISNEIKVEINPMPYRYVNLYRQHGTFRFTVLVSGENVEPQFIKIVFKWNGIWDQFETRLG